ncbi:hypothetical protein IG631_20992 [Alternaria alternata]|nr:hypothetical protein IG631_20992 [Alternaria alternata]
MQRPDERTKALKGYIKIKRCCEQAKQDGYRWAWVDTCCIDKRSSAELSEAINSMYRYYWGAEKCYAYLTDVGDENSGDVRDDLSDVNSIDVVYDFQEPSVELPRSIRPGREIFQFLNSRWFK